MIFVTKLKRWKQAGLLDDAQYHAILAYESANPQRNHWWLYSLMILGAVTIGLGVISIIAANWADLSDTLKLSADFALLSLLAVAIFWQYQQQATGAWFESGLMLFMLLCLASIGLIAQIYHLSGAWYHTLLFWAALTGLLSLFSQTVWLRFCWVSLFLQGATWSLVKLTVPELQWNDDALAVLFLTTPLLSASLYYLSQYSKALQGFSSSLYFWFQLSGIVMLAFIDMARSGGDLESPLWHGYIVPYGFAIALALGILFQPRYRWLNKGVLLAALSLVLLYFYPDWLFTGQQGYVFWDEQANNRVVWHQADDLRAPLLTITILFLYAIHAATQGQQRSFNIATFLIGLRFVVLYFQAMGGLAATGIGLIISGVIIISIAWLWYQLQQWTKERSA